MKKWGNDDCTEARVRVNEATCSLCVCVQEIYSSWHLPTNPECLKPSIGLSAGLKVMYSEASSVYIDLTVSVSQSDLDFLENSDNGSKHASDCIVISDSEDKR